MYNINDRVRIINNNILAETIIVRVNLDNTFNVKLEDGTILRIYREDMIE